MRRSFCVSSGLMGLGAALLGCPPLALRGQALALDRIVAEDRDRVGDIGDFVAALGLDCGIKLALCN